MAIQGSHERRTVSLDRAVGTPNIRTFMSYIMGTDMSKEHDRWFWTDASRLDRDMRLDGYLGGKRLCLRDPD